MNTQQIFANSEEISLNKIQKEADFCTIWPTAKQGLQLLADIIKNPIVKFTISGIIAGGDAIAAKVCS